MDEENSNLNDTTETKQTSGAEKVEKAGNATAKGVKAGKTIAKIVKSLKGLGALGTVAIVVLIVIVVIIIVIGVIGFFLEMPGLLTNKIADFAGDIADEIESFYSGNKAYFNSEEQVQLAQYLENMGYPPYEYGFGQYKDKDGNYITEESQDDEVSMNSRYLNAYLTADYNTYVIEDKFKKTVSDFLHGVRNGVGSLLGIAPDEQEATFGMLVIDESEMDWIENLATDITTDARAKTMTIKTKDGLFTSRYYVFNMAGWTARYGKPLELSTTLHLATMAPDLVYRLDMDMQEDTKIRLKTTDQFKANIKFEYHITTDEATNFAGVDSNLSEIDDHIRDSKELSPEDLKKLKNALESYKQSEKMDDLEVCYANYEKFLEVTIDDENVKKIVKDDDITIKTYIDSNEWYKNFLGTWADVSLENLFKNLDTCIADAKKYKSDAEFYTDDYFGILGEERAGIYRGDRGIMKEYYEKRDSLENDGELSDEDCDELLNFMQEKLGELKDVIDKDMETLRNIAKEQDENSQKLQEELRKIGLTEDSIDKAIEYNDGEGENEGTDIDVVQPYIVDVTKHWYKDVIFENDEYSAYDDGTGGNITNENVFNPASGTDDSALAPNDKGAFYTVETISGSDIKVQTQDAIRGETNPHTKELFVGTADRPAKYFVYDGSKDTAEKIDVLRLIYNAAYNSAYSSASGSAEDKDKTARNAAEDAVEAKEDQDGTNFYKEVDVRKNALSAFSILENSKSEDADYILRDLKALFVDLGYFTKDDLRTMDTHVFQWPLSGYVNTYWPQRRFEKQQADHGTLIRSKTSTDNIRAGLNADGSERTQSQTDAYIYGPNFDASSTAASTDEGVPDLDEDTDTDTEEKPDEVSNPTNTLIDGFEAGTSVVSPVTGEILEEGNDYIKIKVLDTSSIPEYEEFYNEYKGICTGYIMYIKGFQKGTIDSSTESAYQKVTHTGKYFIENGFADDYRDLEDQKILEKFEEAEQKRVDAPAYLEVNGKRYIKEGTVIGTTTNSDIGLYLLNRENSVVEDVESYIRLVKKGIDTEIPEKFIFWLGVKLEGGCEGEYDLGDAYGVEVLADGAGNTTAFGLTKAIAGTGKVPEMYPQFSEHLAAGRVPKQEAQDVFILVLEAARESILESINNQSALSESMLDALIDLNHASPSECSQVIEIFNQKNTLTIEDFENHWGTNTNYETQLKGRAYVRGALAVNEEYRNPYNGPSYPEFTFNTETPWSDFISGTPSSQIVSGG